MLFSTGAMRFVSIFAFTVGAISGLTGLPSANAQPDADDHRRAATAQRQAINGSFADAFVTAAAISDDQQRNTTLGQLSILRQVSGLPGGSGQQAIQQTSQANQTNQADGSSGGLTEADFDNLIDLITGSISPDSWIDTGSGLGTIQPFPAGVYVDAKGTLQKSKPNSTTISKAAETPKLTRPSSPSRTSDANSIINSNVMNASSMRVVSLNRLERQTQLLTAQGKPMTDAMKNLAGLTEIQVVAYLEDSNDVVIAGPGGPWQEDERGRSICTKTGKPILQLDDFVVCLQNARNSKGKFGCSIVPRPKNLAATKQFLATSKLKGKDWQTELRNVLGQQDIEIFGIPPTTHTAYILVEADYHMKLIGMGLEPSVDQAPSYLDRVQLDANGNPPPLDVARWWFTLNYDRVRSNASSDLFKFSGPGVKVLSETEFIDSQGQRTHTGDSVGPTKSFAEDFTTHFEQLADTYSIYQQLKNVFDLAMAANLIHDHGLARRASWEAAFFNSGTGEQSVATYVSTTRRRVLRYPLARASVPRQVDSVINDRVIRERVKSKTRRHTIVGVSGGVSVDFGRLLSERRAEPGVTDQDASIPAVPDTNASTWWWDQ